MSPATPPATPPATTTIQMRLSGAQVLALIPHRAPFRFIDSISSIDERSIVAGYRFRSDEYFYAGHFPGNPVTPGVVLVEALAQAAVVALGIYNFAAEGGVEAMAGKTTVFTDFQVDLLAPVGPNTRVTVHGQRQFFRRGKIRSSAEMRREDGVLVCQGVVAGMGVAL